MRNKNKIIFIFLIQHIWCLGTIHATPVINWKVPSHVTIKEYLKIHKDFTKRLCSGSSEFQYNKLHEEFLRHGLYIPMLENNSPDIDAIQAAIPELKRKLNWIEEQIDFLNKRPFPDITKDLQRFDQNFQTLLDQKKIHFINSDYFQVDSKISADAGYESSNGSEKARSAFKKLKDDFDLLLGKIPFMLNYKFPVDHFGLRAEHDSYRGKDDLASKKAQNLVSMNRKILEDGSQNLNRKQNDAFFRSLLSTYYLRLQNISHFPSEDFIYDTRTLIPMIQKQIGMGKAALLERLTEWKGRTEMAMLTYERIISASRSTSNGSSEQSSSNKTNKSNKNNGPNDNSEFSLEQFLVQKMSAKENLKSFTLNKQKETFHFWMKYPEIYQALFVMETILYNEVGNLDGRDFLYRNDIVQVVINRHSGDLFSKITTQDSIYPYVQELGDEEIWKHKWLNVLFKEGEFSFTYYYIPASTKIYCPDMSKIGRFLRNENLKISLELLQRPRKGPMALRYFSRHSMIGRIDMAPLWSEYRPLPERPGSISKHSRFLKNAFEKKDYNYIYSFKSGPKNIFHVLEFNGQTGPKNHVLRIKEDKSLHFYYYRNPHYFRFFAKKD